MAYWLADGFHRLEAYKRIGAPEVEVDVRQGGRRDALLHAIGANTDQELGRTRADTRRSIELLLRDPEWGTRPTRWIAETAKVTRELVRRVWADLESCRVRPKRRTGAPQKYFSCRDEAEERTAPSAHASVIPFPAVGSFLKPANWSELSAALREFFAACDSLIRPVPETRNGIRGFRIHVASIERRAKARDDLRALFERLDKGPPSSPPTLPKGAA